MRYRAARWPGRILVLLFAGAAGCSSDDLTTPSTPGSTGTLEVTTSTTGTEMDPDGYTVQVDAQVAGPIGSAATIHSDLAAGDHTVQLAGLAANCTVTGENPRTVSLTAGQTMTVTFAVTCGATSGGLQVSATTTGPSPDADGYTITVDGADGGTVGASAAVSLGGVTAGQHEIGLSGVAANCTVGGDNPQTVTVGAGSNGQVTFTVSCTAAPASVGSLRITTATTGANPDPNGYRVAVDGGGPQPIGVSASLDIAGVAAGAHQVRLSGMASNCSVQGGNPRPVTVTVGASAKVAFTVSCSGTAGSSWTPMTSGTATLLLNASGSSATNVFAAGQNLGCNTPGCAELTILHYDGTRWATQLTQAGGERDVWAAPNGEAFALVDGNSPILRYDGRQWSSPAAQPPAAPPQEDISLNSLWGSSATDVFAVGTRETGIGVWEAYIVHYDGVQWTPMQVPGNYLRVANVWGSSATDVYVVAQYVPYDSEPTDSRAVILHYDGRTWSEVLREPSAVFTHIWGASPTDVYAAGHTAGDIAQSTGVIWHYDGHGWSPMANSPAPPLWSIWGSSSRDIYVLAYRQGSYNQSGSIWHFDGAGWKEIKTSASSLRDIWGSSATDIFAVGADGTILHGP